MNDLAYQETMFMLDSMEYQINRVYRQAEKELEEKVYKFYKDFARLDAQRLKEVADGKITQAEYDQWRRNKIFNGKVWEQRKDIITKDLHNAHDLAQSVVYGYLPEVYAVNHNFATYRIEQDARIDTSYTLYSHETVERLLSENPELIPYRKLNEAKFNSWTKKNIQAVMLQGVLQGESIPRIAKRLAKTVSEKDRKCAIRDARTMTTGAMNGGKYDALKRVQKMGVNVRARWRATFDDRTRDSHRALDGEIVDIGQPFSNGLLFPVDLHELESGEQISVQRFGIICRETYNCRCAVQGVYKGLEPRAIKYRSDAAVGIPYEDWKKGHKYAEKVRKGEIPAYKPPVEEPPTGKPKRDLKNRKLRPQKSHEEQARTVARLNAFKATNKKEAIESMKAVFYEVKGGINRLDEKLLVENVNRFNELNERFKGVKFKDGGSFFTDAKKHSTVAYVQSYGESAQQDLALNPRYFKSVQILHDETESAVKSFWHMPCSEENYNVYTITHEYGHIIENNTMRARMDFDDIKKRATEEVTEKVRKRYNREPYEYEISEKTRKIRQTERENTAANIRDEILQIAKENNKDFSLKDNLSRYGHTNSFEFFAEVFANSQCGEPNELGKAMIAWLEKEGY